MRSWPPRPTAAKPQAHPGQAQRRHEGRCTGVRRGRCGRRRRGRGPGGRGRQPGPGARHAGRDVRQRPWQPGPWRQPGSRRLPRWRGPRPVAQPGSQPQSGPRRQPGPRVATRIAPGRTATPTGTASSIAAAAVPRARNAVVSARSAGSKRRPIARRKSRPRQAAPASSTSCPRATASCAPPGTCPVPRTSTSRCRRCGKHSLRKGDTVTGKIREAEEQREVPGAAAVDEINGMDPELASKRPQFDNLTPLFPNERFRLENGPLAIAERIVDLMAPIGKGQRGMIVSPPKAARPRSSSRSSTASSAQPRGARHRAARRRATRRGHRQAAHVLAAEVVYSTFDRPTDEHTHVAELDDRARQAPGGDGHRTS